MSHIKLRDQIVGVGPERKLEFRPGSVRNQTAIRQRERFSQCDMQHAIVRVTLNRSLEHGNTETGQT